MTYFGFNFLRRKDNYGVLPKDLVQLFETLLVKCALDRESFDPGYALQSLFQEWSAVRSDEEFCVWLQENNNKPILYVPDDSGALVRSDDFPVINYVPEELVSMICRYLLSMDLFERNEKAVDIYKLYRDIRALTVLNDYLLGYLICEEGRYDLIEKIKALIDPKETSELSHLLLKTYAEVKGISI